MRLQSSSFAGLNLGAPAAERDAGLMQYFVESEAFSALEAGRAQILIGNRGSGKSAILRYLAETQKRLGAHVVEILPENYSYEMLKDLLAREMDGNWAKQSAYLVAWKYVIYILAIKELANAHFGASRSKRKLHAFLREDFTATSQPPLMF